MARNKDNRKGFDPSALMAGMEETVDEVKAAGNPQPTPQPAPPAQEPPAPAPEEKPITQASVKTEATKKTAYKKRSFYITDEQYDAIKLIAATSKNPAEKDQSQIVRTAIDQYRKSRKN